MKLELKHDLRLELMICVALSKVKFTEFNTFTNEARKLVSYDFPEDMNITLDDIVKIIFEFKNHNYQIAELFLKNFARKDPDRFRELAYDQNRPYQERLYKLGQFGNTILAISTLFNIDYSYQSLNELI